MFAFAVCMCTENTFPLIPRLSGHSMYMYVYITIVYRYNRLLWIEIAVRLSQSKYLHGILTLVMLNKLRCHAHFQFSASQIT